MPKKGERMTPEQRAKIRSAIKAKNAAASQTAASQPEPFIESAGGVEVEVSTPVDSKPMTLLDRVKALRKTDTSTPASKENSSKESEESFIFALVPVASGFLAYHAGTLWSEEYRDCAPTKAEVSAVLKPIARIVSRRLQIDIKETPDIRDMRMAATALLVYILRAATLSMEISAKREGERAINEVEQHLSRGAGNFRGSQSSASSARDTRTGTYQDQSNGAGGYGAGSGGERNQFRNGEPSATKRSTETDAEYARRVISEAFKQDQQYRTQHGLL